MSRSVLVLVKNIYNGLKPRSLTRVGCLTLVFLLLSNLLLPPVVDFYYRYRSGYFVPDLRLPHNFMMIYKDFPSTLRYIEAHRDDYDYNIIVIGDSVMYGAGVGPGQTVSSYLEEELRQLLPHKTLRVWNLAIPGSKPGDMYLALRRVEQLQPDALVADLNMLFYGPASTKDPVAFNWLYLDPGLPADATEKMAAVYQRSPAEQVGDFLAAHWKIYSYRDLFNAILFDKHPRDRFEESVLREMRERGWNQPVPTDPEEQKQQKLYQLAFMYQARTIDEATNPAYGFTRLALERMEELDGPAAVLLTAQNVDFLGQMVDNDIFRDNVARVQNLIRGYDVAFFDFYGRIPGDQFHDHVHLNPQGNRAVAREVAQWLADQLPPVQVAPGQPEGGHTP